MICNASITQLKQHLISNQLQSAAVKPITIIDSNQHDNLSPPHLIKVSSIRSSKPLLHSYLLISSHFNLLPSPLLISNFSLFISSFLQFIVHPGYREDLGSQKKCGYVHTSEWHLSWVRKSDGTIQFLERSYSRSPHYTITNLSSWQYQGTFRDALLAKDKQPLLVIS